MTKSELKSLKLPDLPGVYYFVNKRKKILYIGKATSLKSRVTSYFSSRLGETRSLLILNMVSEATTIEFTVTDSVLEALLLETSLINTHKPKFNTKSKDDKSYNHLIITDETWPRVLVVRGRDITEKFTDKEIKYHFGPFPSSESLREALKIIRKLFRYYDTKDPVETKVSKFVKGKIDFNRQIGLYPETSNRTEYLRTINHLRLFFSGKKQLIIKDLEKQMKLCAKKLEFERAHYYKKRIFALQHIEDVSLLKREVNSIQEQVERIEAYDIAHLAGKSMVGVMTVVSRNGALRDEYRKFKVNGFKQANDPGALREILKRRLNHPEWPFPALIVVDGNEIQLAAASEVVKEARLIIPVVAVVKNKQHKADRILGNQSLVSNYRLEILLANAESHRFAINYHRLLQRKKNLPSI